MTKKHGPDPQDPTKEGRWFTKQVKQRRKQGKVAKKARKRNR